MTADELRDLLIQRAKGLDGWFKEALITRELRENREITEAGLACIEWLCGGEESFHDDDLLLLRLALEDKDRPLQDTLGLLGSPRWEGPEVALVVGLILAETAAFFASESHKRQLLAALMLIDAAVVMQYWTGPRGIGGCRNPDARVGQIEAKIQDLKICMWFREKQRERGKSSAEALHNKPGGSRDKQTQIRNIWATGKYSSRDLCVEQECTSLGMPFSTARKALRNTPDPNPWPAKAGQRKKNGHSSLAAGRSKASR